MLLSKCPRCGFEDVIEKKVDVVLRGGEDAAVVNVLTEVCLHCGERMYTIDTIRRFEQIQKKLASRQVDDFQPIGRYFRVPNSLADEDDSEKVRLPAKLYNSHLGPD